MRIYFSRQENRSNQINYRVSAARNLGLESAIGEYIIFVDSDDWVDLNLIESCVDKIMKEKPDILLFDYVKAFRTSSKNVRLELPESQNLKKFLFERLVGQNDNIPIYPAKLDIYNSVCCKIYSKDVIQGVKLVSTTKFNRFL